jgi:hypothetical protein
MCVLVLAFALVAAGTWVARLHRRCRSLANIKEAWKEYAIAVEASFDCMLELHDVHGRQFEVVFEQSENADAQAELAADRLYSLGEYPDAYGTSPFLPPTPPVVA